MGDDVADELRYDPSGKPTLCTICGRPLGYSIDDQPYWPTGPICGECYESNEMDNELAWTEEEQGDGFS